MEMARHCRDQVYGPTRATAIEREILKQKQRVVARQLQAAK